MRSYCSTQCILYCAGHCVACSCATTGEVFFWGGGGPEGGGRGEKGVSVFVCWGGGGRGVCVCVKCVAHRYMHAIANMNRCTCMLWKIYILSVIHLTASLA